MSFEMAVLFGRALIGVEVSEEFIDVLKDCLKSHPYQVDFESFSKILNGFVFSYFYTKNEFEEFLAKFKGFVTELDMRDLSLLAKSIYVYELKQTELLKQIEETLIDRLKDQ